MSDTEEDRRASRLARIDRLIAGRCELDVSDESLRRVASILSRVDTGELEKLHAMR